VFLLLFVLAFGVVWGITEFATGLVAELYGGQTVSAQYGASDIALDLLVNAVGTTDDRSLGRRKRTSPSVP